MPHLILSAIDLVGGVMAIVGLGFLVFFHELGHFLACRWTGTRVETFSVGFGPTLWGWRRGRTLYKIGAIPLGGYVKMAAENPRERATGAPDELPNKSFSQRLLIFTAGVLFNAALGFLLFVVAFRIGVPYPSPVLGFVQHGEAAWVAGLRAGDRVTRIDGSAVLSFEDIAHAVVLSGASEPLLFTIVRDGETLDLSVRPRYAEALGFPEIGVERAFERGAAEPVAGSPAAKAGGRGGDVLRAIDGVPVAGWTEGGLFLLDRLDDLPPGATELRARLRVARDGRAEEEIDVALPVKGTPRIGVTAYEGATVRAIRPGAPVERVLLAGDVILAVDGTQVSDLALLRRWRDELDAVSGIEVVRGGERVVVRPLAPLTRRELALSVAGSRDLSSARVVPLPGTPAEAAGIRSGDEVLAVGATDVRTFAALTEALQANGTKPVKLRLRREGGAHETVEVTPREQPVPDVRSGDAPWLGYPYRALVTMHREPNALGAIATGWDRTVVFMKSVLHTIRGLVTRRVSSEAIGGPITLVQAGYNFWAQGVSRFLYILAIISVNLAILNILPIPVLDGGQVVLLFCEKIRGRPLPERVVGMLQMVGLVLILGLLVLAFKNDITRLLS
ncbi:MAG: site-2 protease family protein [Planctomycetota bacterium]